MHDWVRLQESHLQQLKWLFPPTFYQDLNNSYNDKFPFHWEFVELVGCTWSLSIYRDEREAATAPPIHPPPAFSATVVFLLF